MNKLTKEHKKTIVLSSLGGMLEFYDFIIFIFFAASISKLFYPDTISEYFRTINTYAIFAIGYFARPLGGIMMAHFGDKFGRKNVFMLSILLMVIPTFIIGIIPTYSSIGYIAPISLIIIRVLQGVAIGGELPGAWTFLSEHMEKKNMGRGIGTLTASVAGGILLGSIISFILRTIYNHQEIDEYAWRFPFIIGGVFGLISIYLRKYLSETPIFKEMKENNELKEFPLKDVLKNAKSGVILSILSTWILTACVLIFVLILPINLSKLSSMSVRYVSILQIIGIFLVFVGSFLFGLMCDRFSIKKTGLVFSIGLLITSTTFFYHLIYNNTDIQLLSSLYLISSFFVGIITLTPMVMVSVFEPSIRFSGISFSYNTSYAIFGGLTPILFSAYAVKNLNLLIYYFAIISIMALIISVIVDSNKQKRIVSEFIKNHRL